MDVLWIMCGERDGNFSVICKKNNEKTFKNVKLLHFTI
jgi:hypothetical protein